MKSYQFNVETIEAGQRKSYGDSYYTYKVTSIQSEWDIKNFCMNVLKPSCEKEDMTNPFDGQLLEFEKITNNNDGRSFLDPREEETYIYKVKTAYTG